MTDSSIPCPLCRSLCIDSPVIDSNYLKCRECALWFLLPKFRLDAENEKDRYLLHTHDSEDEGYQRYLSPLLDAIIQKIPKGAHGLDYGCGPDSLFRKMLTHHGYQVSSYDPFFCPDELALSGQYDFVVSTEVCEHFYNPAFEFQRLRKLVKPTGTLGIMTRLYDGVDFSTWFYRRDPTHVVFYCKETFQWIAEHYGWNHFKFIDDKTLLLT